MLAAAAALVGGLPSPLEGIAQTLMEWTPVGLASVLLLHAGTLARPGALLGSFAIALLIGGIAGVVAVAGGQVSRLLGLVLSAGLLASVLFLPGPAAAWPIDVVAGATYLILLAILSRPHSFHRDRRDALVRSVGIVAGAAALLGFLQLQPVLYSLSTRRLFTFHRPRGFPVSGLSELVTPTRKFYVMDKVLQYPDVVLDDWRLRLTDERGRSRSMTFHDLSRLPRRDTYVTLECVNNPVGGPLIGNALWTGVPLMSLLGGATARSGTVTFSAADGYQETMPLATLARSRAMLIYGMNGDLLPREHGFPARLIVPGMYGYHSVKWLTGVQATRAATDNLWTSHGWTDGAVHIMSRVDVARRSGDLVFLAGIAFAGSRGVGAVEVRADSGPWRRARVRQAAGPDSWAQWAIRIRATAGSRLQVRAIDAVGQVQDGVSRGAYPNGATGWPSVNV
ncbi:MAG: molybdopterin-dependent oxidoreductase [Chloroflexota bacterium]